MFSYDCGGLGSGCYGLRYRFGNPRLNVIANKVKHPSLQMNAVSEAISKELSHAHTRLLRASPIAMTLSTEGGAVPAAHFVRRRPPHPSRNSPPSPLFFKREGRSENFFILLFPFSNKVREGE